MNYPKAKSFDSSLVSSKIMGQNPLLLTEELFQILEQGTEVCSKNRSAVKGVWPMAGEANENPASCSMPSALPITFICLP